MVLDLYYHPAAAASRSVLMTAKAVGVELNLKEVDLMKGEQLKPEFVKLNPQHTIPTLVDDGFSIWESRAIQIYLIDKYASSDALYPKCPKARALVNQRLFFDIGTLYTRMGEYYYPILFFKQEPVPAKLQKVEEAFEFLNTFLEGSTYVAGDSLTIADISLASTVSTAEPFGFNVTKYPNIVRWIEKCKQTIPGYDLNEAGVEAMKELLKKKAAESN